MHALAELPELEPLMYFDIYRKQSTFYLMLVKVEN